MRTGEAVLLADTLVSLALRLIEAQRRQTSNQDEAARLEELSKRLAATAQAIAAWRPHRGRSSSSPSASS
jgi:hypothetical protein